MPDRKPLSTPTLNVTSSDELNAEAFGATDVLVIGMRSDGDVPAALERIDPSAADWFPRLVEAQQVRAKRCELTQLTCRPGESTTAGPIMVLVVGLGNDSPTRSLAVESAATAIRQLADRPRRRVTLALAECFPESMHDAIVTGAIIGSEGQGIYQSEPGLRSPDQIAFVGVSDASLSRGQILGEAVNHTRRLVNEPPDAVYPQTFSEMAKELVEETEVVVEVWDEQRLREEGCRAILAVGAGSSRPPRLLIMRYQGGGDEPPLAIVGKGVTFDSGGLSLKPSEAMTDMKCDMAGAATVVGVMRAVAKLGLRQNVVGLCGLAENMVSGSSYKLGDVIQTRSGKTIEILNTDAEGRVVLADTLDVAIEQSPRAMVDLATLTGACMVALGTEVAGMMTNHQGTCDQISASANTEGEPVWQLPMFKLYDEKIKSKVADIKNIGEGRWAGAITAAKFLENFVGDVPWVHIDIAGPAFAESPKPHRDAGGTGYLVRSLVRWVESQ